VKKNLIGKTFLLSNKKKSETKASKFNFLYGVERGEKIGKIADSVKAKICGKGKSGVGVRKAFHLN
jgi:hypothetical protein